MIDQPLLTVIDLTIVRLKCLDLLETVDRLSRFDCLVDETRLRWHRIEVYEVVAHQVQCTEVDTFHLRMLQGERVGRNKLAISLKRN